MHFFFHATSIHSCSCFSFCLQLEEECIKCGELMSLTDLRKHVKTWNFQVGKNGDVKQNKVCRIGSIFGWDLIFATYRKVWLISACAYRSPR